MPEHKISYKNEKKRAEAWIENKNFHRLDGPAFQRWYENGQKHSEVWSGYFFYMLAYTFRK